jgi:hypothetical protein
MYVFSSSTVYHVNHVIRLRLQYRRWRSLRNRITLYFSLALLQLLIVIFFFDIIDAGNAWVLFRSHRSRYHLYWFLRFHFCRFFTNLLFWLFLWLRDWLFNWWLNRFTHWNFYRLIDWNLYWLTDWLLLRLINGISEFLVWLYI